MLYYISIYRDWPLIARYNIDLFHQCCIKGRLFQVIFQPFKKINVISIIYDTIQI